MHKKVSQRHDIYFPIFGIKKFKEWWWWGGIIFYFVFLFINKFAGNSLNIFSKYLANSFFQILQ